MKTFVAVLVIVAIGCAQPGELGPGTDPGGNVVTIRPGEVSQDCADETEDLVDALRELNSRLSVGLSFDEYGDFVADARVEYDR